MERIDGQRHHAAPPVKATPTVVGVLFAWSLLGVPWLCTKTADS